MKKLVAGPWVGEFGWELMSWQAHLRKMAKHYDHVTVIAPSVSSHLYEDFCDDYIGHSIVCMKDCWSIRQPNPFVTALNKAASKLEGDRFVPFGLVPVSNQDFIKFGTRFDTNSYDVVIHARDLKNKDSSRSWSFEKWNELVEKLVSEDFKVAAIGTEAWSFDYCEDLRASSLKTTCDIIASSRIVVGPSSGPMHLASLCGTKHLVWTDARYYSAIKACNKDRYEKIWNPLNTKCKVLETGWNPSVSEILEATIGELEIEDDSTGG